MSSYNLLVDLHTDFSRGRSGGLVFHLIKNFPQLELDMEQHTGSKLGKEYIKAILSPCLFNFYAEYIMRNAGLDEAQARIKIAGRNINNLRCADDTTLMAESEEELKSLWMKI